jgi:4-hydroxybenzoate polyprenyltransferase
MDHVTDPPSGAHDRPAWVRDVTCVVVGVAFGAAALSIGLITMLVGSVPIAVGTWYVWRDAGVRRLTFAGAFLVGVGLVAWPLLGAAVTNRDPAVRYSDGTVELLIASLVIGAVGVVLTAAGIVRSHPVAGQ